MAETIRLGIVSDIHYASAAEQARGKDYELRGLSNPLFRFGVYVYRHFLWQRNPMGQNHLLDEFLARAGAFDYLVANGDYSCSSAFVGVSDAASCQSVKECLGKLRQRFGPNLRATYGDHELGKLTFGRRGGMRLASWHCACQDLGLEPFWLLALGKYVLMGVVSSLVALPVFKPDTLPGEWEEWERLRAAHLVAIRQAFAALKADQRVLLFCHDPTALPFLWEEEAVRAKLPQVEQTIIGHLHSNLVLWKSRWLAGMPTIGFLGPMIKRFSRALSEARRWQSFHVRLCPALAGIQLLNDGGYLTAELDPEARQPGRFERHHLPRR